MKRSNTTSTLRKASANHAPSTRPASAAANHRINSALPRSGSRNALPPARPVSVTQEDDDDSSSSSILPNKRKGMLLPPIHESSALVVHRPRNPDNGPSYASVLSRLPSVLDGPNPFSSATSSPEKFSFSHRNISLSTAFRSLSLSSNNSEARSASFSSSQEEPLCPKTPSQIPKLKPVPKTPRPPERGLQIFKTPHTKYTIHNASPGKITYLNRNSNTPAPAWDTKGRLEDMESLYSQLKSQLDSAATEKTGMEEGLAVYKTRSMFCILLCFLD